MLVGCFEDAQLQSYGISHRPAASMGRAGPSPDASSRIGRDNVVECAERCAGFGYFGVGAERLVGGPCVCGEMPIVEWRRDEEGLDGLKRKTLRSST